MSTTTKLQPKERAQKNAGKLALLNAAIERAESAEAKLAEIKTTIAKSECYRCGLVRAILDRK